MQLVIRRFREGTRGYNFRIHARMVVDAAETGLIDTYRLHTVALTEGNKRRDRIRAAIRTVPVWIVISYVINRFLQFTPDLYFSRAFNFFYITAVFVVLFYLIYQQIREEVRVADLLAGRDFRARSFIDLLEKEYEIRKMSDVFASVVEQSKTWQEPEVIELAPQPLLTLLGRDSHETP